MMEEWNYLHVCAIAGPGLSSSPSLLHCACCCSVSVSTVSDRLVGLVVKASASRAEGPGFESRLCRDFFGVESYQ